MWPENERNGKQTDMAKDTTGRLHVTVKTGGKRKLSSKLWLERQLNDPYVAQAKREGLRSRAAYKLIEIDDKYHFLKPGLTVVDLGAAPTRLAATWLQPPGAAPRATTVRPGLRKWYLSSISISL